MDALPAQMPRDISHRRASQGAILASTQPNQHDVEKYPVFPGG